MSPSDGGASKKGKRGGGAGAFGQVKIFNERSTDARVQVKVCTQRYTTVVVAPNGDSTQLAVAAGASPTWTPSPPVQDIVCVLVDEWSADGTTMLRTFGLYGVGLVSGVPIPNVRVTLSGVSDITVDILDTDGTTPLRTASQTEAAIAPLTGSLSVACAAQSSFRMRWYGALTCNNPVSQDTDAHGLATSGPDASKWMLVPVPMATPTQYQFLSVDTYGGNTGSLALGTQLAPPTVATGLAIQALRDPAGPAQGNAMLVIQYSDGGFQIVDLASGLALTSSGTEPNQLQWMPPDSPSQMVAGQVGTYLWNIAPYTLE